MTEINFRKIAECIADEILPVQKQLADEQEKLTMAIEILEQNGLADEYFRRRRKKIVSAILLPNPLGA